MFGGGVRDALILLLGRRADPDRAVAAAATEGYVMLALQQVLPANLDVLDPHKVVECRSKLQEELIAFRAYVKDRQAELVEMAQVPDEAYRLKAFARHVESTVEQPLAKLERGPKLLKIPSTRSVLSATALTPPVLLGGDHLASASPMVASAAAAAALVGTAWWAVSDTRAAARSASPVGYLLDVRDELTTKTVLSRARRIVKGTYG